MAKVVFSAVSSSSSIESVTTALSNATFVAFNNASGVYPDVIVWERTESDNWAPVAWSSDASFAGEISGDELEMELLTQDGSVLLGADCTRQQFYEAAFGSDAFAESAFADSDPEELGFESDVWFPGRFEAPGSLVSDNGCLVEYREGLDWAEAEKKVRKDLDDLDKHVHEEMYGHSYRA